MFSPIKAGVRPTTSITMVLRMIFTWYVLRNTFYVFTNRQQVSGKNELPSNNTSIESLELKKISFNYGEQQVLKDFCFKINRGDFIGITGLAGSGKNRDA